ncbi:MAG TPA: hypothetical protein VL687_04765, partial [Methylomirabilota bacterium]|nr:hypothetical protein [Methylomirabilota bacterium]
GILAEAGRGRMSQVAPLLNPFILLDGTRNWLVGKSIPDSPVSDAHLGLWVFGLLTVILAAIAIAAVLWRYRRIAA